jgi:nitroreductase
MNFLELVKKRYSVRNYDDTAAVGRDKIERCIEAARLAPSACNSQPWKFIVVDEPDLREKVARAAFTEALRMNEFAFKAPVLVVLVSQRQKFSAKIGGIFKRKDYSLMDIGIAAEHFCLQAVEEGLGSCLLGWFNEKPVKRELSIPRRRRVELIISVGHSADERVGSRIRKSLEEVMCYNEYLT